LPKERINATVSTANLAGIILSSYFEHTMPNPVVIQKTLSTPDIVEIFMKNNKLVLGLLEQISQKQLQKNDPDIMADVDVRLESTIRKIQQFLHTQNIDNKITIKKYTDYEFSDWQKIQLTIEIGKNLAFTFRKLKPTIYRLVYDTLPSDLRDKILVKFEILK